MTDTIQTRPYSPKTSDYLIYYLISYGRMFITLPSALVIIPLAVLLPLGLLAWDLHVDDDRAIVSSVLPLLGFWFVLLPILGLLRIFWATRSNKTLIGERTAVADDNQFHLTGNTFVTHQSWKVFRGVIFTGRRIFLVVRGSGGAFVVHTDAFADRDEAQRFVTLARKHIRNASHKQTGAFYETPTNSEPLSGEQSPPFRLTFGTFAPYYLMLIWRSCLRPLPGLVLIGVFVGLPLWNAREDVMTGHWQGAVVSALLGLAGWVAVFPLVLVPFAWLQTKKLASAQGERRVALTADGVRAVGASYDVSLAWANVRAVNRWLGMILIWSGPQAAIFVPASAFADHETAQAFYERAVSHWQAAKARK